MMPGAGDPGGPRAGRARLFGMAGGGRAAVLARLPESMYGGFLDVPGKMAVEAAHQVAEIGQSSRITPLSEEERDELTLKVNKKAWAVARQVANALGRLEEVVRATGVTPEFICEAEAREGELRCFNLALEGAVEQVADSQRVLAAWLKEARSQVVRALASALLDESRPVLERQRLLIEAAEVLALELEAGRRERQALGQERGEAEHLALTRTLETLREDKDVDPEVLRRVAEQCARLLEEGGSARGSPTGQAR